MRPRARDDHAPLSKPGSARARTRLDWIDRDEPIHTDGLWAPTPQGLRLCAAGCGILPEGELPPGRLKTILIPIAEIERGSIGSAAWWGLAP